MQSRFFIFQWFGWPNVSKERVVILFCVSHMWKIFNLDISNAYVVASGTLKGRELPTMEFREVYVDELSHAKKVSQSILDFNLRPCSRLTFRNRLVSPSQAVSSSNVTHPSL